jgi:glycosyltransferase involved in cell wall biosynthesis
MGAGNLVLAFRSPENEEVLSGTGLLFGDESELGGLLSRIVHEPHAPDLDALRSAARRRAESAYSWDAVTTSYEDLFRRLAGGRRVP